MLELKGLTKIFHDNQGNNCLAVDSIDLSVPAGKICVLLGTSGSGKTTTLKMINRLIEPERGEIFIDGENVLEKPVTEMRKNIGYVIQSIALFPNMTIFDNITVVPSLLNWSKNDRRSRARELLDMVNLPANSEFLNRYPSELSGGQQQRIGVIRALAARPSLVLMDEAFSSIDPINRDVIQDEFRELQRQLGFGVVFVSHDLDEAIKLGDSIAIFDHGRIIQHDTPTDILKYPKNEFVENFLGGQRMLKELRLFTVSDAFSGGTAGSTAPGESIPAISLSASLAEAVSSLYSSPTGELRCTDSQGRAVGMIDHDDIQKFLSR